MTQWKYTRTPMGVAVPKHGGRDFVVKKDHISSFDLTPWHMELALSVPWTIQCKTPFGPTAKRPVTACPLSGRDSTSRPVQILEASFIGRLADE